jgi:hypothetical protein
MTKELNYHTHDQIWEVKQALQARVAKTEMELRKLEGENKDDVWSDYTERKVFDLVQRKVYLMAILNQL